MDKSFGRYLKRLAPQIMAEFYSKPWDYSVRGPMSTEDPATITVHLEFGLTKCEKIVEIEIDLLTNTTRETVNA